MKKTHGNAAGNAITEAASTVNVDASPQISIDCCTTMSNGAGRTVRGNGAYRLLSGLSFSRMQTSL